MANDSTWPHLKRDLRFYPSTHEQPRRLSQEQIEFYNQNGYLKGFRVFGNEETTASREYLDKLLANLEPEKNSYSNQRLSQTLPRALRSRRESNHLGICAGSARTELCLLGNALFLQDARRWKNGLMASRCALLAPHPPQRLSLCGLPSTIRISKTPACSLSPDPIAAES